MSKCYKCGQVWTNENKVETPLLCPKCSLAAPASNALFDNFMAKSKMQELVDKAHDANQLSKPDEAIEALIEAVKLLSRAQQQLMADYERAQWSRTDIPIGAS
jgi:hypothetical protein